LIAFGKPRDGPGCFIAVDGNWYGGVDQDIRRGVLDEAGKLHWTTIGKIPSENPFTAAGHLGAYSCTFAGDGFFIVYLVGHETAGNEINMGVSFDGQTFKFGIKPFDGVNAHDVCNPDGVDIDDDASPDGGSVAYDKKNKRYVTTGSFARAYRVTFLVHGGVTSEFETQSVDQNFMSSVSSDGLSWTPKFDLSQGDGTNNHPDPATAIGHVSAGTSTVCFSDVLGLFVATSTYKINDCNLDNSETNTQEFPTTIEAAGVAISRDGVNWTNQRLGPRATLVWGVGATYAFSYCVTFVKGSATTKGFFLLGATGGTNANVPSGLEQSSNLMWRSEDGITWTQTRDSDVAFPQAMTLIDDKATDVIYL
jgi:hypothetical protein